MALDLDQTLALRLRADEAASAGAKRSAGSIPEGQVYSSPAEELAAELAARARMN